MIFETVRLLYEIENTQSKRNEKKTDDNFSFFFYYNRLYITRRWIQTD